MGQGLGNAHLVSVLAMGVLLQVAGCSRERAPASPQVVGDQDIGVIEALPVAEPARVMEGAVPLPQGRTAREVTATLRQRMEVGDSRAACQLAREVEFCADSEAASLRMGTIADRLKAEAAAGAVILNKNDVLQTMADLARVRSEYCTGMPPVTPGETVNLWRQAALQGDLPSMLRYGTGLAFRPDSLLDTLDELKVYRREGVDMTKRVAQSGSVEAAIALARAYAPRHTGPDRTPLLRQAVKRDAAQSLAYYLFAQDLLPMATSSRVTALALQTETRGLQLMMAPDEVREGEQRYKDLQRASMPQPAADFDLMAQDERDMYQPVPGTGLCERSTAAAGR